MKKTQQDLSKQLSDLKKRVKKETGLPFELVKLLEEYADAVLLKIEVYALEISNYLDSRGL